MSNRQPLHRIREDLDAVRGHLLHPSTSPASSARMLEHLESAVRGLEDWIGQFPSSGADRESALAGVTGIQAQIRQIEPLFENARKLQAGWYRLAGPLDETGASAYDVTGAPAQWAGAARTASVEEAG